MGFDVAGVIPSVRSRFTGVARSLGELREKSRPSSIFVPSAAPGSILPDHTGELDLLRSGNIYLEKRIIPTTLDQVMRLGPQAQTRLQEDDALVLSGAKGFLGAATFINVESRNDFDSRYTYGEQAYRNAQKARAFLAGIPNAELPARLRQFDAKGDSVLLHQLARIAYAPEKATPLGGLERRAQGLLGRALEEIKARATGQSDFFWDPAQERLVYVKPEEMRPAIRRLLEQLAQGLEDPQSNIVQVGASAAHGLIDSHPLGSGVGHLGRLLMERLLAQRRLPPPTLANLDDEKLPLDMFSQHVLEGIQRTIELVREQTGQRNVEGVRYWLHPQGPSEYWLLRKPWEVQPFTPAGRSRISLDGMPYVFGPDGFVYNEMGRPHLLNGQGQLEALPAMNYYYAIRRTLQMADPGSALADLTASTRAWFNKVAADPALESRTAAPRDLPAMQADAQYRAAFPNGAQEAFLKLFDLSRFTPDLLFKNRGFTASTTRAFAISRYAQIDREYWDVERALRAANDHAAANQIHATREQLFDLAKKFLSDNVDPVYKWDNNPDGLHYAFEPMMFAHSPLRFSSLAEAIAHEGDDHVAIYRGTVEIDRILGLQPEEDPRREDAMQIEAGLGRKRGVGNILRSFVREVGNTANGTLCTTSDPGMEIDFPFAKGNGNVTLALKALPGSVKQWLEARIPDALTSQTAAPVELGNLAEFLDLLRNRRVDVPAGFVDVRGLTPAGLKEGLKYQSSFPQFDSPELDAFKQQLVAIDAKRDKSLKGRLAELFSEQPELIPYYDAEDLQKTIDDQLGRIRLARKGDKVAVTVANRMIVARVHKGDVIPGMDTILAPGDEKGQGYAGEQELTLVRREQPWDLTGAISQSDFQKEIFPPVGQALTSVVEGRARIARLTTAGEHPATISIQLFPSDKPSYEPGSNQIRYDRLSNAVVTVDRPDFTPNSTFQLQLANYARGPLDQADALHDYWMISGSPAKGVPGELQGWSPTEIPLATFEPSGPTLYRQEVQLLIDGVPQIDPISGTTTFQLDLNRSDYVP